jgi:hypothetical protein
MKVIFLDNDGVICLAGNWGSRYKKRKQTYTKDNPMSMDIESPVEYRFDDFDTKAIKVLNDILTETGAEIVVSSDWKLHATVEELGDYYISKGIIKRPIAKTPNLMEFDSLTASLFNYKGWSRKARILEIEKYLELNPEITHWVAVDDLNMSPKFNDGHGLSNFVLTPRSNEGIKQSGIKNKILKYLL